MLATLFLFVFTEAWPDDEFDNDVSLSYLIYKTMSQKKKKKKKSMIETFDIMLYGIISHKIVYGEIALLNPWSHPHVSLWKLWFWYQSKVLISSEPSWPV